MPPLDGMTEIDPLASLTAKWTMFPLHPITPDGACGCGNATCKDVGKHPAISWGSLEPGEKIKSLEDCGYGIACGERSGFFAVDLDLRKHPNALAEWERLNGGTCPLTYTVQTGSGGWHFYFNMPGFKVANSSSLLAKGIDVRGSGGYVVSAWSPHKSGGTYEAPIFADIADAPAWLVDWLRERKPTEPVEHVGTLAPRSLREVPPEVVDEAARLIARSWTPSGQRCDTRLALSGALHYSGFSESDTAYFAALVHRHIPDRGDVTDESLATIARDTFARAARGGVIMGWTALEKQIGAAASTARDLLTPIEGEYVDLLDALKKKRGAVPAVPIAPTSAAMPVVETDHFSTRIKRGVDWDAPYVRPQYLIEGLIPKATLATWFAEGGSVKSWAAFAAAISVATGCPWLGVYAVPKGKVLILDFEDGFEEFRRRKEILTRNGKVDLSGLDYLYAGPNILDPKLWVYLGTQGYTLVVIDALNASMPAGSDENDQRFSDGLKMAGRFVEANDCNVLAVHHANKQGGIRGSSTIRDQSDVVFRFEPVSETDSVKRMRMVCDKPGPQKRPQPVNIELSDDGLRTFEDEPQAAGRAAKSESDIRNAIRLAVESHEVSGYRELAKLSGLAEKAARHELRIMLERGDVVRGGSKKRLYLADDHAQAARIQAAVGEADAQGKRVRTVEALMRAACVTSSAVHAALDSGVLVWSSADTSERHFIYVQR